MATALTKGLAGHAPHRQIDAAPYIGAASQQAVSYAVRRAHVRIRYLMTRPALDERALGRVLAAEELETVRDVYATASFAAVARLRFACPDRKTTQRYALIVKRAFLRALAKVERAGLDQQVAVLRHLVANLRCLHFHAGKGRRRATPSDGRRA